MTDGQRAVGVVTESIRFIKQINRHIELGQPLVAIESAALGGRQIGFFQVHVDLSGSRRQAGGRLVKLRTGSLFFAGAGFLGILAESKTELSHPLL